VNATDAARAALAAAPGALFLSSLGTATSALRAASDDGPHLYLGGAMGNALGVALGLAGRKPERSVVALLGDGELLMGASSLWSLAGLAPPNLLVVVLADGSYSITGGQELVGPTRFAEAAAALGLAASNAETVAELHAAVASLTRPGLVEASIEPGPWPGPSAFVDPSLVRLRFQAAL